MRFRTVTLIWLLFGAVAWCRAQGIADPPILIAPDSCVTVARPEYIRAIDSGDTVITVRNSFGQTRRFSLHKKWTEPLTLDSLVVLWDEYKSWCISDSGWMEIPSLSKCYSLGYTVEDNGWHIKIYRKADFEGFMSFIRRKAVE